MQRQHRIDFANSNLYVSYWLPASTAKSPNQKKSKQSIIQTIVLFTSEYKRSSIGRRFFFVVILYVDNEILTYFTVRMKALRCCQIADSFVCELWWTHHFNYIEASPWNVIAKHLNLRRRTQKETKNGNIMQNVQNLMSLIKSFKCIRFLFLLIALNVNRLVESVQPLGAKTYCRTNQTLTYVSFATALHLTLMLSWRNSDLISSIHCAIYLA